MKQALIILLVFTAGQSLAQGEWSMQQCMQYAVEHNHEVKRAELELDNYKASKTGAIGRFLCLLWMPASVPSTTSDVPSTLRQTAIPM